MRSSPSAAALTLDAVPGGGEGVEQHVRPARPPRRARRPPRGASADLRRLLGAARNLVTLRCAAVHLSMSEATDRGNLAAVKAYACRCLLRRWKDTLAVLHSTRHNASLYEKLGLTSRCVDAVAVLIASPVAAPIPARGASARGTGWRGARA